MRRAAIGPGAAWRGVLLVALLAGGGAGADVEAAATAATGAAEAAPLEHFLEGLHTLRTRFTQIVTGAHGRVVAQATGELIVLRPGRFRWEIHPAGESAGGTSDAGQLVVADGRNLWFYDPDLQQVTVRSESTALTATPAMLLSGGPDALAAFTVSGGGERDGLSWVQVTPRSADADFKQARLGFSGGELQRMILEDKLGETSALSFEHAERNVPVAPSEVSFSPPAGVDVIGKPEP